jgi:hypothetical protein
MEVVGDPEDHPGGTLTLLTQDLQECMTVGKVQMAIGFIQEKENRVLCQYTGQFYPLALPT